MNTSGAQRPEPQPFPPPFPLPQPPAPPVPPLPGWPLPARPPSPLPEPAPGSGLFEADLADRLLARRIVLVTGPLDREAATDAAARLMLLDAESAAPVELHLGCPDADLESALVLAETVDLVRAPVTAVLKGTVGGPALAVVAAADRRVAHPSCRLVLREPPSSATGTADDLTSAAEQRVRLRDELCTRLAAATRWTAEEVAADLHRGRVLTAQEAVDAGLVDELVPPRP